MLWSFMFFIYLSFVYVCDNEAQERRVDVMSSSSLKKKQLYSLLDLLNTIGQQQQVITGPDKHK